MWKKSCALLSLAVLLAGGAVWAGPFEVNHDGTIMDAMSGVEWCGGGSAPMMSGCSGGPMGWADAQGYVDCLNEAGYQGYSDWRMPTVDDFAAFEGNQGLAAGMQNGAYWTGTEAGGGSGEAFAYTLGSGLVDKTAKAELLAVWPVRDSASILEMQVSAQAHNSVRYPVTVIQSEDGKITPVASPKQVKAGQKKTYTVKAEKGHMIETITVTKDGVPQLQDLTGKDLTRPFKLKLVIDAATEITATFVDAPDDSLTMAAALKPAPATRYPVTIAPVVNGKITPVGLTNVKAGQKKTFTVKADTGYVIETVTVTEDGVPNPVDLTGKDLTKPFKLKLTIDAATEIAATFVVAPTETTQVAALKPAPAIRYPVTVAPVVNGKITPVASPKQVKAGQKKTYTVKADAGYMIETVTVTEDGVPELLDLTGKDLTKPLKLKLTIDAATEISATFVAVPPA